MQRQILSCWGFSLICLCSLAHLPVCAQTSLEFEACSLSGSGGNGNLSAECATWQRPLNNAQSDGEFIELFVVRLKSTALEPAKDAFTIINGGPGGSSIDMLVDLSQVVQPFTRNRDVIVVDQRGTGRSAPMKCAALTDTTEELSAEDTVPLTKQCLDTLPHDPRYFSTTAAVQDLEQLRSALGYQQLSVYGVSYGTRVAMQYLREFPNSVRALVIDGVVPPQQVLGANIAIHSQDALNIVFRRCEEDPGCKEYFPNLAADFGTLSSRLKSAPIPLTLHHPLTGAPTDMELGYVHLITWIRFALYSPEMTSLIPLIIHQATHKEIYLPIAANALRLVADVASSLNYGMHNAVMCTEDAPFYAQQSVDFEALEATYIGREMFDTLKVMCSVWPQGTIHPAMKQPITGDTPTLVLSGEYDPITPPAWGAAVLPGLSNAKHIVVPGQGHGTIARGCVPKLILEFVEHPSNEEIDTSCIDHLSASPFFVNAMGPPP